MIFPWKPTGSSGNSPSMVYGEVAGGNGAFHFASQGVIVYLELDNRKCTEVDGSECFINANEVEYNFF